MSNPSSHRRSSFVSWLVPLVVAVAAGRASACPFCSAQKKTLSQEIDDSAAVVFAKFVSGPPKGAKADDLPESTFEIVKVLKGADQLGKTKQLKVLYFGNHPADTRFILFGIEADKLAWGTPNAISERAAKYIAALIDLPKQGPDRLAFFQEYLEDPESILAGDAYDEFARAPYGEVKQLAERIHHDKLLTWIQDREVPASRRRLYLTMLGVCGTADDVPILEAMIKSPDRQVRTALDAMAACYLILRGPEGLPLIEDLFFKDEKAEYSDTYAAIMAIRFLGQESTAVPKERLVESLHFILERPQLADLVIPDLARWQDWSVVETLVDLFKKADEESSWVRVPVINYLRACPKPEAKEYLAELEKIDPDSVKRANSFFALPPAPAAEKKTADKQAAETQKNATKPAAPAKPKPAAPAARKQPAGKAKDAAGASGTNEAATRNGTSQAPRPGVDSLSGLASTVRETNSAALPAPHVATESFVGESVALASDARAEETAQSVPAATASPAADSLPVAAAGLPTVSLNRNADGPLPVSPRAVPATDAPLTPANRLQVLGVAAASGAVILGLVITILRGNA